MSAVHAAGRRVRAALCAAGRRVRPVHRVVAGLALACGALLGVGQVPAQAHPLGNFTVNHYHGLRVLPDRVEDSVVVDRAEIPTLQAGGRDDAGAVCADVAGALRARAAGRPLVWRVRASGLAYPPGQAKLRTTRISCSLSAGADLARGGDVEFADGYDQGRIGWREVTATAGGGVRLAASDVPERSVSGELRRYPDDLLSDPLDVRAARLRVAPGDGPGAGPGAAPISTAGSGSWLAALDARFAAFTARDRLTLPMGLAAVALSLLLGAAHAALPGHGKTVMAACMAGRRGRVRDAVAVGATVTFTHTAGVLAIGLLLTVSASLAADRLLNLLGVVSGLLVAGVGVVLLRSARAPGHRHHGHHAHRHAPHPHGAHTHVHEEPGRPCRRRTLVGMGVAGGLVPSPSALVVLLGAVALNRTGFGVALVLGYGVGMAAVLTCAGLLVARFGERAGRLLGGRAAALWHRWRAKVPYVTAALVTAVGAGLALRAAVPLLYG
ncbi:nickel/cobalt transporter [Streptomyces sp. NPDC059009]|uniref:nickel/cobalt transporter n=1 Tax=Streptomyces sp. NPDC059009 TaxID=3346694 RepID=UPI0036C93CF6